MSKRKKSESKELYVLWQENRTLDIFMNVEVLVPPQEKCAAKFLVDGVTIELGPILWTDGDKFLTPYGLYEVTK